MNPISNTITPLSTSAGAGQASGQGSVGAGSGASPSAGQVGSDPNSLVDRQLQRLDQEQQKLDHTRLMDQVV